MHKIIEVTAIPPATLFVKFDDGLEGAMDMADRMYGPVFEPLKDPSFFSRAAVDSFGAVCWPNGADLAPDVLHRDISRAVGVG